MLKSIIIVLLGMLIIIILLVFPNQENISETDLFGKWNGYSSENIIEVLFDNERQCKIGIKNINSESVEEYFGNYFVDFSKQPIPLTIRNINQLNHPIYTSLEFVDKNSFWMSHFTLFWKHRSVSISNNNSILLKKEI